MMVKGIPGKRKRMKVESVSLMVLGTVQFKLENIKVIMKTFLRLKPQFSM